MNKVSKVLAPILRPSQAPINQENFIAEVLEKSYNNFFEIDMSNKACQRFGFNFMDSVETCLGEAVIFGTAPWIPTDSLGPPVIWFVLKDDSERTLLSCCRDFRSCQELRKI